MALSAGGDDRDLRGHAERLYRKLRVFVACPSDLEAERACLRRVIDHLNEPDGIADQLGFVLTLLDWRAHVAPLMGRPEGVILDQLPVRTWDVFVGMLWLRFGTPTGATNLRTGEAFESGTEEEFTLAYDSWRRHGRPQIMFFRCLRPVPPNVVETAQLQRVREFFDRFRPDADHPGLPGDFRDVSELERLVTHHLPRLLSSLARDFERMPPETLGLPPALQGQPPPNLGAALRPGEAYQLALMSVDMVGHGRMVKKHADVKDRVLDEYRKLVFAVIHKFGGDQIDWAVDGGIFAFWGEARCNAAALAGIQVLEEIKVFNLDHARNPLPTPVEIRVAATDGLVVFRVPIDTISADSLNLVAHLEKKGTPPDEFRITETLFNGLDDRLRAVFPYAARFEDVQIRKYGENSKPRHPSDDELKALSDRMAKHVAEAHRQFNHRPS